MEEEVFVIASSSTDSRIVWWNLTTGMMSGPPFMPSAFPSGGLTTVGSTFLAASHLSKTSSPGSISYWGWTKVEPAEVEVRSFPEEGITALVANTDGSYIIGGAASGHLYLWEVKSGNLLKKWLGHPAREGAVTAVTCLAFLVDQTMVVSGSQDGTLRVWNLASHDFHRHEGPPPYMIEFNQHKMAVNDVVVYESNKSVLIISASDDKTCKVWNLEKRKLHKNIDFPSAISSIVLGSNIEWEFFAGGKDGNIYKAEYMVVMFNRPLSQFTPDVSAEQSKGGITSLAYHNGGGVRDRGILISGSENGIISVWNLARSCIKHSLQHGEGPVNNIKVVRRNWGDSNTALPPPLQKDESGMDGRIMFIPKTPSAIYLAYNPGAYQISKELLESKDRKYNEARSNGE